MIEGKTARSNNGTNLLLKEIDGDRIQKETDSEKERKSLHLDGIILIYLKRKWKYSRHDAL